MSEASAILLVLQRYESLSGQRINLSKSEVSFSASVKTVLRDSITHHLGVGRVDHHELYLGLPTVVGRSKKITFSRLKDRLWQRLKGWKEKFLSWAGKETLIKAVAQAIPTYIMQCFLLPVGLCQDLQMMIRRFWWRKNDDYRRMHLCSWNQLCNPKSEGGLGFRDMECFNRALLAKQGWRVLINPNSLISRILKARYFPETSFLEASIGSKSSYTWRSLVAGRALLEVGSVWQVGDGMEIKVWKDRWIPQPSSFRIITPCNEQHKDLLVGSLIDHQRGAWRWDLINKLLLPVDVDRIKSIPIVQSSKGDRLTCFYHHTGNYVVKSGYRCALALKEEKSNSSSSEGWTSKFWKRLWNLKLPPKIVNFLWRVSLNSLPVKIKLHQRIPSISPSCQHCNSEESVLHLFRDCQLAKKVWQKAGLAHILNSPASSFKWWFSDLSNQLDAENTLLFSFHCYQLWISRNKQIHKGRISSCAQIHWATKNSLEVFKSVALPRSASSQERSSSDYSWQPPPFNVVKINTDAGILGNEKVGLGAVFRNHSGQILFCCQSSLIGSWSPLISEALAIQLGLTVAKDKGLRHLEVESDNKYVIDCLINKTVLRNGLGSILDACLQLSTMFASCIWRFTHRNGNRVAHSLAKCCPPPPSSVFWDKDFPPCISESAMQDVTLLQFI